jgi:hypothetical protein
MQLIKIIINYFSCIFLAGNGAFFVNYVITSAFIGTALELLRFSELFLYGIKLLMAKSSAERTSVRKASIDSICKEYLNMSRVTTKPT